MIGRVLDKYEILAEVGQGGMSIVYRGRDRELLREVAVKVLHPHLASHAEAKARFLREAQAVAKLRHDNILEIYDYSGAGATDAYIVTEFIHGQTLKEFVTAHRLAYPELAAMVVSELCAAVAHAHRLGVLHRDIKPENVMVRDDGRLKLMDFGIAQILDAQRMTVTGALIGSPAYMSPEHVEGRPLDFRTDVFSLGIVLYQLATGELPFYGKNPHEILKRIGECTPPLPNQLNPLVSEKLSRVIIRALSRDPAARQQEARELGRELGAVLADAELAEPRDELTRFFAAPAVYTQALRQRLIDAYARRGRAALGAGRRAAALELWNRVLEIDPSNEGVAAELERLSRKRAGVVVLGVGGVLALVGGAAWWHMRAPATPGTDAASHVTRPALVADAQTGTSTADAAAPDLADAGPVRRADAGRDPVITRDHPNDVRADAGRIATLPTRRVIVTTQPKVATLSVDAGAPVAVHGGRMELDLPPGAHVLTVENPLCHAETIEVTAADTRDTLHASLTYLPRRLTMRCPGATAITVDEHPVTDFADIELGKSDSRSVVVEFLVDGNLIKKNVDVRPGTGAVVVPCVAL